MRSPDSLPLTDDASLANRVRAGDASALETLFGLYYDPLCRFAEACLRSHADAEDLVQELFVRLWAQRQQWVLRGSIRAYLYTAVRNSALNVLKHQVVRRRLFDDGSDVERIGIAARDPTPDEAAAVHELGQAIDRAVANLPERYRLVMILRAQHHLTVPEIARILDLPVKTAETRAARAVVALRVALERFLE